MNRFQREVINRIIKECAHLPSHIRNRIVNKVDGFHEDEFYSITIILSRLDLLCIYGCISIKLDDNKDTEDFMNDLETFKSIKQFQQTFHDSKQSLYARSKTTYNWGRNTNMKSIKWNTKMQRCAEFIKHKTNQEIEKILVTKYDKRGASQPYHSDENNRGKPTQLINISMGETRELEIIHKHVRSWKRRLKLKERRMYIFTHLFNKQFKHKYVHNSNNTSYSITFRSEI